MTLDDKEPRFLLIYASQTGQAQAIAEEIAERAPEYGLCAELHCVSLTEKKFWLERESCAVVVTSTTGEGDPPDTALKFWRRLRKKTLPNDHLAHLNYTLLGLGDTNYTNFCNCGKTMDARLAELGASRFYPSDFADDAVGLEIVVDPWIEGLFPAIRQHFGLPPEEEITANPLLFGNTRKSEVSETTDVSAKATNESEKIRTSHNEEKNIQDENSIESAGNIVNSINRDPDCGDDGGSTTLNKDTSCNSSFVSQSKEMNDPMEARVSEISASNTECVNHEDNDITTKSDDVISDIPKSDDVGINDASNNSHDLSNSANFNTKDFNTENIKANQPILNEDQLANALTRSLVLTRYENELGDSLIRSSTPLSEGSLTLPVCPARFLQLQYSGETLDTSRLSIQNECSFPSAASEIQCVPVIKAVRMTASNAVKTALKLSLDIKNCGWSYEPGDAIGVVCPNSQSEVSWLLNRLQLEDKADEACSLSVLAGTKKKNAKLPEHIHPQFALRHALATCCDIRAVPKKAFIRALVEFTSNAKEKRRLQELCSKQGAEHYTKYIREPTVCILDLLAAFPSCAPPVEVLFEHLPRLNARPYSACSSAHVSPGVLECVFNVVEVEAASGRAFSRHGVCTGWLDRITKEMQTEICDGDKQSDVENPTTGKQCDIENSPIEILPKIPIFLRTNQHFRAPADLSTPFILIGPGTGVAPFVGFLLQRDALMRRAEKQGAVADTWLFYGCRHSERDYLFREQLERLHLSGALTHLNVCFSRDPQTEGESRPRYVQDNLKLHGEEILEVLSTRGDSRVYVCGDARGMARGVHETFIQLLQTHRGMDAKDAESFMFQLRFNKRYSEDVWT